MGEWSDYFESFPEENPANYVNGIYDPAGALRARAAARAAEQRMREVAEESKALRAKLDKIASDARRRAQKRSEG